ncbi:MAG: DUF928 domain-containing protein [Cyanobacteria bacterium P01_F01_bin.150]
MGGLNMIGQWVGSVVSCGVLALGVVLHGQGRSFAIHSKQTYFEPLLLVSSYNPPRNGGPDGERESGGSRPGCPAGLDPTFTALVPLEHIGDTVSERPTFWLYVPYASALEFVLFDQGANLLHREEFEASEGPGVVGFTPSQTAPALDVDQVYKWRFDFFCGSSRRSSFLTVTGEVVRRSPSFSVEGLTEQERASLYAANGFWYEALTEVATLLQKDPTNEEILSDWAALLEHPSIGLAEMVEHTPSESR